MSSCKHHTSHQSHTDDIKACSVIQSIQVLQIIIVQPHDSY